MKPLEKRIEELRKAGVVVIIEPNRLIETAEVPRSYPSPHPLYIEYRCTFQWIARGIGTALHQLRTIRGSPSAAFDAAYEWYQKEK